MIDSIVLKFDHSLQPSKQLVNVLLASFHPNIIRSPADIPHRSHILQLQAHTLTAFQLETSVPRYTDRKEVTFFFIHRVVSEFPHALCDIQINFMARPRPPKWCSFRATRCWNMDSVPALFSRRNNFSYGSPLCYFSKGKSGIK